MQVSFKVSLLSHFRLDERDILGYPLQQLALTGFLPGKPCPACFVAVLFHHKREGTVSDCASGRLIHA